MNIQEATLIFIVIFGFAAFLSLIYKSLKSGEYLRYREPKIDLFDYIFYPVPQGILNVNQPFTDAFAAFGAIIGIIGPAWIMVNIPDMRLVGIIYVFFALLTAIVWIAEGLDPVKSRFTAAMVGGFGDWSEQILAGVIIAIPFLLLSMFKFFQVFQVQGMPIASFIVTTLIVPVVEEGFFRGAFAPTVAEKIGTGYAIIFSSIIFSFFHVLAYKGALTLLVYAFAFGFLACFVDFHYKSIIPGAVGHMLINYFALVIG